MKHRRNTNGFTYLRKAGSAKHAGGLRCQEPFRGTGNGVTPGCQNNDVVFNQFFDHGNAAVVMSLSGIITSDHPCAPPDPTVDNVIIQGVVRAPEGSPQMVFNGFNPESCDLNGFMARYHHICAPVRKIINGNFKNSFGVFDSMVFIKFNVNDIVLLHPGNGMGRNQLGVETFGNICQVLEDTLDIDNHRVARTGDDDKLNAFINLMESFGILELARTGKVAMVRELSNKSE